MKQSNQTQLEILPQLKTLTRQCYSTIDHKDDQVIAMWLKRKSIATKDAYSRDIDMFRNYTCKPIEAITLGDLYDFCDSLDELSASSRNRRMSAIKSLLTFASKIQYLPFNVGAACQLEATPDTLASKLLTPEQIQRMIDNEPNFKARLILRFLYYTGVRVSELANLRFKNLMARTTGGQAMIFGKGSKTRHVLIPQDIWQDLARIANGRTMDDSVFSVTRQEVWLMVKNAGERIGLRGVGPHYMRHSHATNAIDQGAPLHLVQKTLGHKSLSTTGHYLSVKPGKSSGDYL